MKRNCIHLQTEHDSEPAQPQQQVKKCKDYDNLLKNIESHPDYVSEMKLIQKVRLRRLNEAERNRIMQIKNLNALYDFEVENIEASTKLACEDVKDYLREALLDEQAEEEEKNNERLARTQAEAQAAEEAASLLTSTDNLTTNGIIDNGYDRRRTRSLSLDLDMGEKKCNGLEEAIADLKTTLAAPQVSARKAAQPATAAPVVAGTPSILLNRKPNSRRSKIFGEDILQNSLSEEDVRADFLQIVHHLEDRAMAILNSEKESRPTISATVDNDEVLTIATPPLSDLDTTLTLKTKPAAAVPTPPSVVKEGLSMQYRKGSMVVVRSSTSAEDLSGTVTVVSADKDDVVIRMHTGPRIRVPLDQVRCGRVTIARDVGAYRDMALIMAARSRFGSEQSLTA
mmetsp:Transcript_26860/g.45317  ORF Transcript_26860/g.45317 Transcript_26860/m.45317 type:complete len:398 (+) Transcript_26860:35-1228(+)